MQTKVCGRCKKELSIEKFYRNGKNENGETKYHCMCKECTKKDNQVKGYARQKKYKYSDIERLKKQTKKYKESHKEQIKASSRKRYLEKTEFIINSCKRWRDNNKEYVREIQRNYHHNNIEKMRLLKRNTQQRRMAKQNNLINTYTQEDWQLCLDEFKNSCAYCGIKIINLHQEHVIPLSKGGAYVLKNIVPSCTKCNSSKFNYDMEEWYKRQDFFSKRRLNKIYKWVGYNESTKTQQLALC